MSSLKTHITRTPVTESTHAAIRKTCHIQVKPRHGIGLILLVLVKSQSAH